MRTFVFAYGCTFVIAVWFANSLWRIISAPVVPMLMQHPIGDIAPMDAFQVIWVKSPALVALFASSPVLFWQMWRWLSPRVPQESRRWAAAFVIGNSLTFLGGGCLGWLFLRSSLSTGLK
ncbi:hypothetical protein F183_A04650 [Bryobacterales bacterium F-183]|nr:hypothetical protein F183_A04650 [Bryobacterales bacterium F-183]